MTAAEAAKEAAWLETVQSRRPLPPTASQLVWESRYGDTDEAIIRARRAALLGGFRGGDES